MRLFSINVQIGKSHHHKPLFVDSDLPVLFTIHCHF